MPCDIKVITDELDIHMECETYNNLVESIYDAALNPVLWDDAMRGIRSAFSSEAAGFFIETKDHKFVKDHVMGIDHDQMAIYGEHYAPNNPWFTVPGLMKPGRVLTDYSLEQLYNDKKAFLKTEMYQGWCRTLDFRHLMGGNLLDKNGNMLNFSFFRSHHSGHYSAQEVSGYSSLCRHLIKAVELNQNVGNMYAQLKAQESALNTLRIGIVTLGNTGRMEYMNEYARQLIYKHEGLFEHASYLKAVDELSNRALSQAISSGYKSKNSTTITVRRPNHSALSISVIPSTTERTVFDFDHRYITLFITDPDDRDIGDAEYLVQRWSLTPVEAEFACYLLKGLKISQVAEHMELTQNTAQWYSKQLLRKLDVAKQSELIIKLMNDMAHIKRP